MSDDGTVCDPRFGAVREEFERNFAERREVGASVCVTLDGETVIDLGDSLLVPGFIDVQVNGGGGVNLNETPTAAGVQRMAAAHQHPCPNVALEPEEDGPRGKDAPNPFGIFDLGENVHEWCSDWFSKDYYSTSPERNPAGPPTGDRRASRGGSWRHHVKVSRCAARSSIPPEFHYADYGFRVVRGGALLES